MPTKLATRTTRFLQTQRPRTGYEWLSWAKELRSLHKTRAWLSLKISRGEYYERLMMGHKGMYAYFAAIKAVQQLKKHGGNPVILSRMGYMTVLKLHQATKRHPQHAEELVRRYMLEAGTLDAVLERILAEHAGQ